MTRLFAIDDPLDPRIAAYRAVRERDLVGREGLFVAEGETVLRVLVGTSPAAVQSLLIAEKRVDHLAPLVAQLPPCTPVYAAGQAVMDSVVGFHIHRGILALGRRPADPGAGPLLANLGPKALVLALFGIANHDNMGGMFRNAAAFGVGAVLLAADCCDPLYRKAIRVSVGGALVVPFAKLAAGEDPIDLLAKHGFTPLALSPSGRTALRDLEPPARAAVLLGAEGPGLPAEILARCQTISIPMAAGFDSLNVATTSGIVLHQLTAAGA